MILKVCRGLCVLNMIIGIYLIATAIGSGSTPGVEKSLITVMSSLIWASLFFMATYGLFFMMSWARRFMIGLYGACAFFTVCGFLFLMFGQDRIFAALPGAVFSIYLLIFAVFVAPLVFMLRSDVKNAFDQVQEDQEKQEEQSGRATFKRPE